MSAREPLDSVPFVDDLDEDAGPAGLLTGLATPCAAPGCRARTLSEDLDLCVDHEADRDRARAVAFVPAVLAQIEADPALSLTEASAWAEVRAKADSRLSMALHSLLAQEWGLTMRDRGPVAAGALRARLAAEGGRS